jgi:hypothetical protein
LKELIDEVDRSGIRAEIERRQGESENTCDQQTILLLEILRHRSCGEANKSIPTVAMSLSFPRQR